jgi:hypothetical protein
MSYPPPPQLGQNAAGVARQNEPRPDPRAYQYRPIMPNLRVEPPITQAPTFGQYVRSDSRGTPGVRGPRWAGRISFWLGLASLVLFWIVAGLFVQTAFIYIAAGFSVVALFFGLVAFIAGIGRGSGFWGILFALAGNFVVVAWFLALFA